MNIGQSDWIFHPDDDIDLCILPFDKFYGNLILRHGEFFIFAYNSEYLADNAKLETLRAIETITMIGYSKWNLG
ncbi:MAG: hypothetical protein WKG06_35625 [Segetibacter sp.]